MRTSEFNKSIKMVNKRYQVCWSWMEENPDLPDNWNLGRLNSVL